MRKISALSQYFTCIVDQIKQDVRTTIQAKRNAFGEAKVFPEHSQAHISERSHG